MANELATILNEDFAEFEEISKLEKELGHPITSKENYLVETEKKRKLGNKNNG